MYVCLCHGVTDSEIREAAEAGCAGMSELMMRTGCGSSCGCCVETASGMLEALQARDTGAAAQEGTPLALPVIAAAA
ncbi:MAG: (2Fe-2S)-binding protein [Luteimonas sp.]